MPPLRGFGVGPPPYVGGYVMTRETARTARWGHRAPTFNGCGLGRGGRLNNRGRGRERFIDEGGFVVVCAAVGQDFAGTEEFEHGVAAIRARLRRDPGLIRDPRFQLALYNISRT